VATARTEYLPAAREAVVHDHSPVVLLAVQVEPVLVHVPVDGLVPCAAVDNCTTAPTGAEPVIVSVVSEVRLSLGDEPLSEASARSGADTDGNA